MSHKRVYYLACVVWGVFWLAVTCAVDAWFILQGRWGYSLLGTFLILSLILDIIWVYGLAENEKIREQERAHHGKHQ